MSSEPVETGPTSLVEVARAGEARIIDGAAIAARVREQVAQDTAALVLEQGRKPGLATILIGDDPASEIYVSMKVKACEALGIRSANHRLPAQASRDELFALIDQLNDDDEVSGILCQLPLPGGLDPAEITNRIRSDKDVDGLTIANAGRLALGMDGLRPCTPLGVMILLEQAGVDLVGKHAVVIGRSNLFGKPMGRLLLAANATVTQCHQHTTDLRDLCRQADVLIVAVGQPELVRGDWIKPGAVVIDVGTNRTARGLRGDVCFGEASRVASAITPVPGGVGPMTIVCLMANTVQAARDQI